MTKLKVRRLKWKKLKVRESVLYFCLKILFLFSLNMSRPLLWMKIIVLSRNFKLIIIIIVFSCFKIFGWCWVIIYVFCIWKLVLEMFGNRFLFWEICFMRNFMCTNELTIVYQFLFHTRSVWMMCYPSPDVYDLNFVMIANISLKNFMCTNELTIVYQFLFHTWSVWMMCYLSLDVYDLNFVMIANISLN